MHSITLVSRWVLAFVCAATCGGCHVSQSPRPLQQKCLDFQYGDDVLIVLERPAADDEPIDFFRTKEPVIRAGALAPQRGVEITSWRPAGAGVTPREAAQLAGQSLVRMWNHHGIVEVRPSPAIWCEFLAEAFPKHAHDAEWHQVLYLGSLTSPAGGVRLVAVTEGINGRMERTLGDALFAWVIVPSESSRQPVLHLDTTRPANAERRTRSWRDKQFRLYGGNRDDNDPSHFELRYSRDAEIGYIDGWLDANDKIRMRVRNGPAAEKK